MKGGGPGVRMRFERSPSDNLQCPGQNVVARVVKSADERPSSSGVLGFRAQVVLDRGERDDPRLLLRRSARCDDLPELAAG